MSANQITLEIGGGGGGGGEKQNDEFSLRIIIKPVIIF